MKRLFYVFFLLTNMMYSNTWTPASSEKRQYEEIQYQIILLRSKLVRMGATPGSSAFQFQIFRFLQQIGTPVSYKILKEMIASKELPQSLLDRA